MLGETLNSIDLVMRDRYILGRELFDVCTKETVIHSCCTKCEVVGPEHSRALTWSAVY